MCSRRVPSRVALTLAGIPMAGRCSFSVLAFVPSRYGRRYAYGHVIEEWRHLIVSAGLGCCLAPVRFGVPPEIVLVELGAVMTAAWPDLAGRLVDGASARHILPVRVYFEDTDFSGLVYHASYVRWCERGRSDFLRLIGNEHRALIEGRGRRGAGGVCRAADAARFLKPARIDDVLRSRRASRRSAARH